MKYKYIYMLCGMLFSVFICQTAFSQDVLERFPIDRSTCGGGVTVTAYFDNNRNSGLTDYTCGTKTYEQHSGTDFAPYGSTRASCSVVAAAPGEVMSTADGIYDQRSGSTSDNPDCSNSNSYGNHVKIKQNDGSVVVYAHMKKGSIKVKKGDIVTCGQALGVAQSSGCSTGIHLHFDIAPKSGGTRFDPFQGSCGSGTSRWVSQGNYQGLPADSCQCTPNCTNKQCGDNGCGGSCGSCGDGQVCEGNQCVCVPKCEGKSCGEDGCGGSCGECEAGLICADNQCVCEPQCEGKSCGDDGCGGSCGDCDVDECDSSEAAVCEGNNVKSCKDGKYIYKTCLDNQKCRNGKCVDNIEAASDVDEEDEENDAAPDVRITASDGCSGVPSGQTNAPWHLMFLAGMVGVLRKRKTMKRSQGTSE